MHEKVHEEKGVERSGVRIEYGMPLRSLQLGLSGKADVVEFHLEHALNLKNEILHCVQDDKQRLENKIWRPFPVEYKRGKPKRDASDEVQLCAQALCMEEMLGVSVSQGALFYGKTRRREDVVFDDSLRRKTIRAAARLHELINSRTTPKAAYEPKCDSCSLFELCLPQVISKNPSNYLARIIRDIA